MAADRLGVNGRRFGPLNCGALPRRNGTLFPQWERRSMLSTEFYLLRRQPAAARLHLLAMASPSPHRTVRHGPEGTQGARAGTMETSPEPLRS
jgi:hypothetical protein